MLTSMGIDVEVLDDGLVIQGGKLTGAAVDCRGDHRIAMAAAVAGLAATGVTVIEGSEAADVSYPDFYDDLRSLVNRKV